MKKDGNANQSTVLIIDDTPANLSIVVDYLHELGVPIMIAQTGESGIKLAQKAVPDLILLDVRLPGIDGYETCRQLKANERTKKIPVIFMTVMTGIEDKLKGFQAGGVDYITKPFHAEEVTARVKTHLALYKLQNKLEQEIEQRTAELAVVNANLKAEIAERKRAEEETRRRNRELTLLNRELQLLSAAIEQTDDIIIIIDAVENKILYVNSAFERITGYRRKEVTGRNINFLNNKAHPPEFFQEMWQTVSSGKVWSGRVTRPNKDGGVFTENVTISPIRNEHGNIINYVAVKHNITRELELEAQYRQSQKMEAIGQLAGGIAHDFNNLLVPILGYADLGMRKLSPENALYTDLARIREAGKRAAALTRQILAFSRKQILQVQPLNLNTIVKEFSTMLRRLLRDNINLQLILPPEPGWIEADKTQIEQVLMNLVINAQQAMLNGGELIIETTNVVLDKQYAQKRIEIQPGNYVMMAVSDTGCGMDKETQQRIFEPFFTTKKKDKGTGLGLATVFGIVKQHGGSIWVYSEINQGTTFKIYFPRIKEGSYPSTTETAEITTVFGTETILVVEDEEAVRRLVCETLEAHGYTVIETKNPTHALKMAAAHKKPIHLLLTDVIMPEMNGVELYQTLKEIRPHIKVLYMSGYTDNAIVHHGILKASVHFLQKPFTIHSLTQKVREVFDILPPTQTSKK